MNNTHLMNIFTLTSFIYFTPCSSILTSGFSTVVTWWRLVTMVTVVYYRWVNCNIQVSDSSMVNLWWCGATVSCKWRYLISYTFANVLRKVEICTCFAAEIENDCMCLCAAIYKEEMGCQKMFSLYCCSSLITFTSIIKCPLPFVVTQDICGGQTIREI